MPYLDYNATTPLDERVREAMEPYHAPFYGNPSSLYRLGRLSRDAVEAAREQVAGLVGAAPSQLVFTSGGTESNNLALKGMAHALAGRGLAVGAGEHPSVLEPARALARGGMALHVLPTRPDGRTSLAACEALPPDVGLVSLMWANNETGVVQDVTEIAACLRERGVWLHSDAVQAMGKIPLNFAASGLHLLSVSAHKIYGPKGVGALLVDAGVPLQPLLHGGGQERGLRSGTENLAAIVGFGKAAELARSELNERADHALRLRRLLEDALRARSDVTLFAERAPRLPNTVMFGLAGIDGETLVMALDRQGMAVSSGSACASAATEPSHVLTAMGVPFDVARSAIRVSFGMGNTPEDVAAFIEALKKVGQFLG